jgi:Adenylate and Guanylate cyclase catalytic domain
VFDGPARAIRCALGIVDASEHKGLSVRVGVHTGECEMVEADVRGIAVQVGARIAELAAPGQILVSSTVRDLVAGSGIRFGEGRDVELAGMPGIPRVFPVLRHGASPDTVRRSAVEQTNLLRRDGEYWTVGHRGLVVTLRDTKGLRDLGRLLAEPGREFHVLDLMADGPGARSIPPSQAAEAGSRPKAGLSRSSTRPPALTTSVGSATWSRSSRRPRNGAAEKPVPQPVRSSTL